MLFHKLKIKSEIPLIFTELKKWILVFVKDKCVVNLEIEKLQKLVGV
jgi:hypothetical protein